MAKTIHLIDGEKGGVGKSTVCRALIEWCLAQAQDFHLVDADRRADIGRIYDPECYRMMHQPPVTSAQGDKYNESWFEAQTTAAAHEIPAGQIVFSREPSLFYKADRLVELALEKPVIVNLPAQIAAEVNDWIARNDILEMPEIQVCKWWVTDGDPDSFKLFVESYHHFSGRIPHALICNLGKRDDFRHLGEDLGILDLLSDKGVKSYYFPKLGVPETEKLLNQNWKYADLLEDESLGICGKQRVRKFIKEAYQVLEWVGFWGRDFSELVEEQQNHADSAA